MGQITIRIKELIGERELREGRRLTMAEIAGGVGISPATLSGLANNQASRISLTALANLCAYFECGPGDLLHYEVSSSPADADEVESRDIVARWERVYGADEHPPDQ